MRYAIVSDIHSNLQAWEAVIHDICARDINDIICLGDIIGYGPHPAEVLASVRHYTDKILMGNHDAAVCGVLDASGFYGEAEEMIKWTAKMLDEESLDFFRQAPLCMAADEFRAVHADVVRPGLFDYLEDETTSRAAWQQCSETIIFIGHTHLPAVHKLSAEGEYVPMRGQGFVLERDCRYIINVGSIGMSRDGDYRASYCIFDDVLRSISWCRLDFDIRQFKRDADRIIRSNEQIDFLYKDYLDREARAAQPLRDTRAFLTTQDLTSLIQEFDASKLETPAVSRSAKQVKIRRKSQVIREDSVDPDRHGNGSWDSKQKKSDSTGKKTIIITLIIIFALATLFVILGLLSNRSSRGTSMRRISPASLC